MKKKSLNSRQLDSILMMLIEFSQGNFDVRGGLSETDNDLNAVISGLNMLGEELANFQGQANRQHFFLKNILGSIDEVVYAKDIFVESFPYGRFTFVSDMCGEIIGHESHILLESPELWLNAIHPHDKEEYLKGMLELSRGKGVVLLYRLALPSNNGYRWIEDRIVTQPDPNGLVVHLYGSARDVTKQQQDKLELEDKTEFISRMITSSDQFFYIVALSQEDTFVNNFTFLSDQIETIQGSKGEDLKKNPRGWFELIHPDDINGVIADNKIMFSQRKPVNRIYRVRHAITNEYVWLEDYVIPVANKFGHIVELYGSARDITVRKEAKLKLESLNAELTLRYNELMQFSNIVSHNLKAPVANIMALSKLLSDSVTEQQSGVVVNYLLESVKNIDEQLNDLSVILSTRTDFNSKREFVAFNDIISSIQHSLSEDILGSKSRFEIEIGLGAENIFSIKCYLHSILFNLLSNAIKYRLPDVTPIISIKISKEQETTRIRISDNGPGIDLQANGDNLFDLYSRFDHSKSGSGMGLYMTKIQVEKLGGKINVESELGLGTTFIIIF